MKLLTIISLLFLLATITAETKVPDPPKDGTGCGTDSNGHCYCCWGGPAGCGPCVADGQQPTLFPESQWPELRARLSK